jgi:hypothetical protein
MTKRGSRTDVKSDAPKKERASNLRSIKSRVAKATVRLLERQGQGVLVPGGFILTAAHCVNWSCQGEMVLGDYFVEPIKVASGEVLKVGPLVVEPVNDIAILGELDNQAFYHEANAFEEFCENTVPIPICCDEFCPADLLRERPKPFRAHIRTHKRKWITAKATQYVRKATTLWLALESAIEGGTSGGPVVNDRGELLGVISIGWGIGSPKKGLRDHEGRIARPHRTLPVWVWDDICAATQEGRL